MSLGIEIVPVRPFEDGTKTGKQLGRERLHSRIQKLLGDKHLKSTLGQMSRAELERYVIARLETPPDYGRFPELEDIYPERVDYLHGFAKGAQCSLGKAAVYDYLTYRKNIEFWFQMYQLQREPRHCSGVLLVGLDGVIGAHSGESGPPPKPRKFRHRPLKPYRGLKSLRPLKPKLALRKPRTGYIENWGVANEKGVGCCAGTSCGVWLDEPIEDTWPMNGFSLLRFARTIEHLEELYTRYNLFIWGRASQLWADAAGNAIVVEKSYRRIGIRRIQDNVLWCTEGHWESPEMSAYLHSKRLEYLERAGKHLGAEDMQYATDCAVRFTHLGELCHQPWGRGYEHMRRILTDHSPFPRAICRHAGPDTDPYDQTVTLGSGFVDFTHNRSLCRSWIPWKRFACEVPEAVTQFPARP